MTIDEQVVEGISVYRLTGDFISEPDQIAFQQRVREAAREGRKRVVVDLRGVHYINSCGIGSLVGALTTLRLGGGELYLAGTTREVNTVFETAQLRLIFRFHTTVDEALSAVSRAKARIRSSYGTRRPGDPTGGRPSRSREQRPMEKKFRKDFGSLESIDEFVRSYASANSLDAATVFAVNFVVEEIFTNMRPRARGASRRPAVAAVSSGTCSG